MDKMHVIQDNALSDTFSFREQIIALFALATVQVVVSQTLQYAYLVGWEDIKMQMANVWAVQLAVKNALVIQTVLVAIRGILWLITYAN